jgi:hypothetical protein
MGYPSAFTVSSDEASQTYSQHRLYLTDGEIDAYHDLTDETARRRERDRLVAARLEVADALYDHFQRGIYAESVGSNVGAGSTVLGLNTLGAFLKNSRNQAGLAGLAAFIGGTQAIYEKDALFERTMPSLVNAMETGRNRVRLRILQGLAMPTNQYDLTTAMADVRAYFNAGTMASAVSQLGADSAQARNTSQDQVIDATRTASFATDATTIAIRAFMYAGSVAGQAPVVNPANRDRALAWLTAPERGDYSMSRLDALRLVLVGPAKDPVQAARDRTMQHALVIALGLKP